MRGRLSQVPLQRTTATNGSDDEAAMATAIWDMYTDPANTLRLAQTARDRALQEFGLDAMVHSYETLFSGRLSVGPV